MLQPNLSSLIKESENNCYGTPTGIDVLPVSRVLLVKCFKT